MSLLDVSRSRKPLLECRLGCRFYAAWMYLLAIFMFAQVLVLILQDALGPSFFLPQRVRSFSGHNLRCIEIADALRSFRASRRTTTIRRCRLRTPKHRRTASGTVRSAWTPYGWSGRRSTATRRNGVVAGSSALWASALAWWVDPGTGRITVWRRAIIYS